MRVLCLVGLMMLGFQPVHASSPVENAEAASTGSALPDVAADLSRGLCANGPGAEGADSYFSGTFTIDGTTVSGTERWILYANPKWAAKGGVDCQIEWTITGSTSDTGSCADCDLGLQLKATADTQSGGCPEEMRLGRLLPDGRRAGGEAKDFEQKYAIKKGADGAVQVYFAKSGKLLGEGYHSGSAFNYVSAHQRKWF